MAVQLRSIGLTRLSEPENVGFFNQVLRTEPFMTARGDYMETYVRAGHASDIKDVWEMALFHALELLRLDASGSTDALYVTPFILLNLHRDDDAFGFIRYWTKINIVGEESILEEMYRHIHSQEGE